MTSLWRQCEPMIIFQPPCSKKSPRKKRGCKNYERWEHGIDDQDSSSSATLRKSRNERAQNNAAISKQKKAQRAKAAHAAAMPLRRISERGRADLQPKQYLDKAAPPLRSGTAPD